MKSLRCVWPFLILIIVFSGCKKPEKGYYSAVFSVHRDDSPTQDDGFNTDVKLIRHKSNSFYLNTEQRGMLDLKKNNIVDGWIVTNRICEGQCGTLVTLDTFKLSGQWQNAGDQFQINGNITTRYATEYYFLNDTIIYEPGSGTFEFISK